MNLKAISEENKVFERARKYAILHSGYKFIKLILKDGSKRNCAGIHILNAYEYWNQKKRKNDFKFVVDGGAFRFSPDESMGGADTDWILDDEHNRRFLASHRYENAETRPWDIENESIDKKIKDLRESFATDIIGTSRENIELAKKIKEIQQELVVCSNEEAPQLRKKLQQIVEDAMQAQEPLQEEEKEPSESMGQQIKEKEVELKKEKEPKKRAKLEKEIAELTNSTKVANVESS